MPKCCILKCRNRTGVEGVTFHRKKIQCLPLFPFSRPYVLEKWIRNIGRKDFKPSKTSVVCSVHFEDHCYVRDSTVIRNILKREAVPTLFFYPLQPQNGTVIRPKRLILSATQHLFDKYVATTPSKNESSQDSTTQIKVLANKSSNMACTPIKAMLLTTPYTHTLRRVKEEPVPDPVPSIKPVQNVSATISLSENSPLSLKINGVQSLNDVKRLSTINFVPDSSMNGQSKILSNTLEIYKQKVKHNRSSLKVKQQHIRRLNKRINRLNETIKELEETSNFAKQTEKLLGQYFSGIPLDIVLGMMKEGEKIHYPPSLKSFALNFYRYSPKAYNYVYSVFKGGFPNPKTVRGWNRLDRKKQCADIDDAILQTIAGSQSGKIDGEYNEVQSEKGYSEPTILQADTLSEGSYLKSNQCSEIQLKNKYLKLPEKCSVEKLPTVIPKKFTSDLDELIKTTLGVSHPEEKEKSESKGYYVIRLENPNSKKKEISAVELNRPEIFNTNSSKEISEEQETVVIDQKNFLQEENCVVVVTTE